MYTRVSHSSPQIKKRGTKTVEGERGFLLFGDSVFRLVSLLVVRHSFEFDRYSFSWFFTLVITFTLGSVC